MFGINVLPLISAGTSTLIGRISIQIYSTHSVKPNLGLWFTKVLIFGLLFLPIAYLDLKHRASHQKSQLNIQNEKYPF